MLPADRKYFFMFQNVNRFKSSALLINANITVMRLLMKYYYI